MKSIPLAFALLAVACGPNHIRDHASAKVADALAGTDRNLGLVGSSGQSDIKHVLKNDVTFLLFAEFGSSYVHQRLSEMAASKLDQAAFTNGRCGLTMILPKGDRSQWGDSPNMPRETYELASGSLAQAGKMFVETFLGTPTFVAVDSNGDVVAGGKGDMHELDDETIERLCGLAQARTVDRNLALIDDAGKTTLSAVLKKKVTFLMFGAADCEFVYDRLADIAASRSIQAAFAKDQCDFAMIVANGEQSKWVGYQYAPRAIYEIQSGTLSAAASNFVETYFGAPTFVAVDSSGEVLAGWKGQLHNLDEETVARLCNEER